MSPAGPELYYAGHSASTETFHVQNSFQSVSLGTLLPCEDYLLMALCKNLWTMVLLLELLEERLMELLIAHMG